MLAQRSVATHLVEPRSVLQLLEWADLANAALLWRYCLATAVLNMDAVLLEARPAFESLPPHLLEELEQMHRATVLPAARNSRAAAPSAGVKPAVAERRRAPAGESPMSSGGPRELHGPLTSSRWRLLQCGWRPTAAPEAGEAPEASGTCGDSSSSSKVSLHSLASSGAAALGAVRQPLPLQAESTPAAAVLHHWQQHGRSSAEAGEPFTSSVQQLAEVQAAAKLRRAIGKKLQQVRAVSILFYLPFKCLLYSSVQSTLP